MKELKEVAPRERYKLRRKEARRLFIFIIESFQCAPHCPRPPKPLVRKWNRSIHKLITRPDNWACKVDSVIQWKVKVKVILSYLTVTPWTTDHQAPQRNFSGKNTGVGCHSLFQGIFPIQVSNPGLLQCRQILYYLSHSGSPDSTVEGPKGHTQKLELYLWNRMWPKISEQVTGLKQYRSDMGGKWTNVKARGGGDAYKQGTCS